MSDVATDKGQNFLIDQRWEQIGWPPLFSAWANCNNELRVGFLGTPQKWSAVKRDTRSSEQTIIPLHNMGPYWLQ